MEDSKQKLNKFYIAINSLLVIAVIFLLVQFFYKNDKIVYVDSGKLFSEYKGAEDARRSFEKQAKIWQSNIDTLTQEVQNDIREYERKIAGMSIQEQTLIKQSIGKKRKELDNYQRAVQENAGKENTKLMSPVVSFVNKFLVDYGKDHNYKMILIASQAGTIAYAREGLDITKEVVEALNKDFKASNK